MNTTIGKVQFPARFFAPAPRSVAQPKGVTIGNVTFPESLTKPLRSTTKGPMRIKTRLHPHARFALPCFDEAQAEADKHPGFRVIEMDWDASAPNNQAHRREAAAGEVVKTQHP